MIPTKKVRKKILGSLGLLLLVSLGGSAALAGDETAPARDANQAVDEGYQLAIAPEDLEDLGLDVERQPDLYSEVMVLALVSLNDELMATANLMAPIVLNVKMRCGLQAIRRDSRYSHQHPVAAGVARENATERAC